MFCQAGPRNSRSAAAHRARTLPDTPARVDEHKHGHAEMGHDHHRAVGPVVLEPHGGEQELVDRDRYQREVLVVRLEEGVEIASAAVEHPAPLVDPERGPARLVEQRTRRRRAAAAPARAQARVGRATHPLQRFGPVARSPRRVRITRHGRAATDNRRPLRCRAMRRGVLLTAAAVLLVGPTVLAFFSGGYFDGPRFVATIVAWTLVLGIAVASPRPLPESGCGPAGARRDGADHRLDRSFHQLGPAAPSRRPTRR